ncbi:MAG: hypothetical protein ACOX8S_02250 [Christensenellales bacterium]
MKVFLTERQKTLLEATLSKIDALFDEDAGLIKRKAGMRSGQHDVRGSAYYALGLLARGASGDIERAQRLISRVLDEQLLCPGEIYHATFKRAPQEPDPPAGNYPWRRISPDARHFADIYLEKTTNAFLQTLREEGMDQNSIIEMERKLEAAVISHFPVVWRTYDPNWREFIGSTFAIVLDWYEDLLNPQLVERLDAAMLEAVNASIDRRLANLYPMNTNVELMHIVMCDYFGYRFDDQRIKDHAAFYAADLYRQYSEFHSFAEYNSPTYCGVDLCVLAQWRRCGKTELIRNIGSMLEAGLWEDVALMYNANLRNLSGGFSRNHEMELSRHTAMFALLYLGIGERGVDFPLHTTEDIHNVTMALCNVEIPEELVESFVTHTGDRQVTKYFRELIERGDPQYNNPLCTVTAWIEKDMMLGGIAGSKNVSGQIHPATLYWKAPGSTMSIRLLRREPGNAFGKGNRTVHYNAKAEKGKLDIDVHIDIQRDMELFFQIDGNGNDIDPAMITPNVWKLPGIIINMDSGGIIPSVIKTERGLEVVYLSEYKGSMARDVSFRIKAELA